MNFKSYLIIFCAIILSTNVVYAHGVHDTGVNETKDQQFFAEKHKNFFEYFITAVDARANISINEQDGYRYIESDGLPDHTTGRFPNAGNPNAISEQNYKFRVSLQPKKRNSPAASGRSTFGVAINGVPFDPGTAEFWNNDRSSDWNIEALTGGHESWIG